MNHKTKSTKRGTRGSGSKIQNELLSEFLADGLKERTKLEIMHRPPINNAIDAMRSKKYLRTIAELIRDARYDPSFNQNRPYGLELFAEEGLAILETIADRGGNLSEAIKIFARALNDENPAVPKMGSCFVLFYLAKRKGIDASSAIPGLANATNHEESIMRIWAMELLRDLAGKGADLSKITKALANGLDKYENIVTHTRVKLLTGALMAGAATDEETIIKMARFQEQTLDPSASNLNVLIEETLKHLVLERKDKTALMGLARAMSAPNSSKLATRLIISAFDAGIDIIPIIDHLLIAADTNNQIRATFDCVFEWAKKDPKIKEHVIAMLVPPLLDKDMFLEAKSILLSTGGFFTPLRKKDVNFMLKLRKYWLAIHLKDIEIMTRVAIEINAVLQSEEFMRQTNKNSKEYGGLIRTFGQMMKAIKGIWEAQEQQSIF